MEIALSLGQPVGLLARTMSEAEFLRWNKYASKKMLPWQRMEWYLAQIAYLIAVTMGGAKGTKLSDFLCVAADSEVEMTPEQQLEQAIVAFDVKPRKKRKQKRKT